jgi:hypothetical protein
MASIFDLLTDQKLKPFVMTKEANGAIEKIKEFLCQQTMLYNPDYSLPFYLATDASNCGMGSMLYQVKNMIKAQRERIK